MASTLAPGLEGRECPAVQGQWRCQIYQDTNLQIGTSSVEVKVKSRATNSDRAQVRPVIRVGRGCSDTSRATGGSGSEGLVFAEVGSSIPEALRNGLLVLAESLDQSLGSNLEVCTPLNLLNGEGISLLQLNRAGKDGAGCGQRHSKGGERRHDFDLEGDQKMYQGSEETSKIEPGWRTTNAWRLCG